MANTVTVKDVAREANVSIGTVSRVFNNHKNVTEEVRVFFMRGSWNTPWDILARMHETRILLMAIVVVTER